MGPGRAAQLLRAADDDLAAAEKLASGEALLAPAVYHRALAAEKALKAYLLYVDLETPGTHDRTVLVEAFIPAEAEARSLRIAAATLIPYGVAYRSIEPFAPDREAFERALTCAYAVHDYVSARMPE